MSVAGSRLSQVVSCSKHGTYDLSMLWVILRVLCQRRLESIHGSGDARSGSEGAFGANLWHDVEHLLGNRSKFAPDKLAHWHNLVELYLQDSEITKGLTVSDIVDLICIEETNAFCLYPKATGYDPDSQDTYKSRGTPYGLALSTRATLFNHSCLANVCFPTTQIG